MHVSKVPKQELSMVNLPEDLLHMIFSNLGFRDKVSAGMVCKEWEKVLQDGTVATRHWEVDYSVSDAARKTVSSTSMGPSLQHPGALIMRCVITRLCFEHECITDHQSTV